MCCEKRGFTLLEMMLALFLMALMSLLAWRALDAMVRTRVSLEARGQQFDALKRLFDQWTGDCAAMDTPDGWQAGVPVSVSVPERIDMIRSKAWPDGTRQRVMVTYLLHQGDVERWESPPLGSRLEWLGKWTALQQGEDPGSVYGGDPVVLLKGAEGLTGQAFVEGSGVAGRLPAAFPLVRGLELSVFWPGQEFPYSRICLTGQD